MAEEHVFDLLPGYALGALDEADLLRAARHLAACPLCRGGLEGHWKTVDALALAAPLQSPPAGLKEKILRRVEDQAHRARPAVHTSLPRPFARPRTLPGLASAALVLLLVLLAAASLLLWRQVNNLRAAVPGGPARIVHLTGTDSAPQSVGYLVIFPAETYGALVVEDAPPLASGYAYQLWLIKDGARTSGGVFSVGESGYGTLEIWADLPLDSYSSFGVTVEPEGGSPGPTGVKILGGGL